jgi:hypothetical protein
MNTSFSDLSASLAWRRKRDSDVSERSGGGSGGGSVEPDAGASPYPRVARFFRKKPSDMSVTSEEEEDKTQRRSGGVGGGTPTPTAAAAALTGLLRRAGDESGDGRSVPAVFRRGLSALRQPPLSNAAESNATPPCRSPVPQSPTL